MATQGTVGISLGYEKNIYSLWNSFKKNIKKINVSTKAFFLIVDCQKVLIIFQALSATFTIYILTAKCKISQENCIQHCNVTRTKSTKHKQVYTFLKISF